MRRLFAADCASEQLARPIGRYLVYVHVRLRARSCRPDVKGEMVIQVPGDCHIGRPHDGTRLPRRWPTSRSVDPGGSFFDKSVRVIDPLGHPIIADEEMDEAPLCL